jgi:hypothetical protein
MHIRQIKSGVIRLALTMASYIAPQGYCSTNLGILLANPEEPQISPQYGVLKLRRAWGILCRSVSLRELKWVRQQYPSVYETQVV